MEPKEDNEIYNEEEENKRLDRGKEIMDMILKFNEFDEEEMLPEKERMLLFYDILKGLFEAGELLRPSDEGFKADPLFGGSNVIEFDLPLQGIVAVWAEPKDKKNKHSKFDIQIHVYRPIK